MKKTISNRFDGIQVLRVIAALLVVITHATFYASERISGESINIWKYGTIGVDIFFIISGFIMISASGLVSNKLIEWKTFLRNRLIRIIPMYWLATTLKVIALLVVPSMVLHAIFDPERIFYSYFLLPQVNPDGRFEPLLGVGWTLIYEMFFYACFTIALFLKINPVKFISILFIFLSIFGFYYTGNLTAILVYTNPIILYFVLGMILFYLNKSLHECWKFTFLIVSFFFFVVFLLIFDFYLKSLLAFIIFWLFLIIEPYIHGKVPKFFLFLGEASYVLYLFHPLFLPIIPEFISRYSPSLADISIIISIPIALIVASIIHIMIEKPTMQFIKNLIFKK